MEAVNKDPSRTGLRYELAELYVELKKHDQAMAELAQLKGSGEPSEKSLEEVALHVKALRLESRVHKETARLPEAIDALAKAKELQAAVLSRARMESPEQLPTQREAAAELAYHTAGYFELQRDQDQAIEAYKDVLKHDDAHQKGMLAVARLQLARGELEEAQSETVKLIRLEP
eukprot:4959443-Prymnesium_polylepis.1